jgi:hypothetical protein
MLRRLQEINGYTLRATDGEIGRTQDFYFDDQHWVVRYMVVSTGTWLGREVLIAPQAITQVSWDDQAISLSLNKGQVERSPAVDLHTPVSRQYETDYFSYFGYAPYWLAAAPPGIYADETLAAQRAAASASTAVDVQPTVESHLRSANDTKGYHIQARDGEIGHVDDFLVDDRTWAVRFIEVDTSNWIGGASVLVPRHALGAVKWPEQLLSVTLTRAQVQGSPRSDGPDFPADYERQLHAYYGDAD